MAANKNITVDKAEVKKAEPKAPLEAKKLYTIIGTGTSKNIPKGAEVTAPGADAEIIINAGRATLKG